MIGASLLSVALVGIPALVPRDTLEAYKGWFVFIGGTSFIMGNVLMDKPPTRR